MIVYTNTDERLIPAQLNIITLQVEKGGFIYIDRATYGQATVLADKYQDDWDGLRDMVGSKAHTAEVDFLKDTLPEPINFLAPFISLIDEKTTFDNTLEQFVGCLHVISRNINFDRILRIPMDVRRTVAFSGHIKAEYELQWEEFRNECVPYSMVWEVFAKDGTFANASIPTFAPAVGPTTSTSAPNTSTANKASGLPTKSSSEPVTFTLSDPADAALASIDPEKVSEMAAEVDWDAIDWDAEIAAMEKKEAAEKKAAEAAGEIAPSAPSSTPSSTSSSAPLAEAESGKGLVDEWGDL